MPAVAVQVAGGAIPVLHSCTAVTKLATALAPASCSILPLERLVNKLENVVRSMLAEYRVSEGGDGLQLDGGQSA